MALVYENLTYEIKQLMLQEVQSDVDNNSVYVSQRLEDGRCGEYVHILESSILSSHGTDEGFEQALQPLMKEVDNHGRRIPVNAAQTLAEGEFNKYYVRAMCVYAIQHGLDLEIIRVRYSQNPRRESECLIGTIIGNLEGELELLRRNDRAHLSVFGPNSGLSVRLKERN